MWSQHERTEIIKRINQALPAYDAAVARRKDPGPRSPILVISLGLVTLGVLGALEINAHGLFRADFPVAPLMLAAMAARMFGLRTARITAALIAPILIYAMRGSWDADLDDIMWATVHLGGLIALCVTANRLPGIRSRRRASSSRAASVTGLRRSSEFAG